MKVWNMKSKERKQCGCGGSTSFKEDVEEETPNDVRSGVRKAYAQLARRSSGNCCSPPDTGSSNTGYLETDLAALPETALSASAGCGNPTAIAQLKPGEVVLDLGSGGGIDVFLAARKVGPTGSVIGVDMTPEMIETARRNAEKTGLKNVEFRLGEIEHLPVSDKSVDIIISNCVINLSPEKDQVFREAYRVLKKGGRMQISDMMASGIPDQLRKDISLWASCVGGAIKLEEYINKIKAAGFSEVEVVNEEVYSKDVIESSLQSARENSQNSEERKKLGKLVALAKQDIDRPGVRISHADILASKN
jgi:arsenite methyltransferase